MSDDSALLSAIREGVEAFCAKKFDFAFNPAQPIIRLHEPTFGAAEINAAIEVMLSTRVTLGEKVKAFEKQFSEYHDYRDTVMVNSGSSANLLALAALVTPRVSNYLRPGDEVIVPALSWSTTVWPVVQMGLTPVIVDIDPATLNICPKAIRAAIGPRTRAIMPVHVYGNPCDMDAIREICLEHKLILIEDCCESLGAYYDGLPVGSFGRIGTFSFYYSHHIATFEGGVCVSNDPEMSDPMRILRAHGWVRETANPPSYWAKHPEIDPKFLFVDVGYNLRPMELQAAMGAIQLPKLADFVNIRRKNAQWWLERLSRYGNRMQIQQEQAKGRSSWFGVCITLTEDAGFGVDAICKALNAKNIETRPIICGNIADQPAMKLYPHRVGGPLPYASAVMKRGFAIANHQAIDDNAREYMAAAIDDFIAGL